MRKCRFCGEDKDESLFAVRTMKGAGGSRVPYFYECKDCKKVKVYANREMKPVNFERVVREFRTRACNNAIKRGKTFDVSAEHLMGMRELQEGKCYYTGLPMTYGRIGNKRSEGNTRDYLNKLKFQMSVDRVINDLGYTDGNVVLCCHFVNSMKGTLRKREFIEACRLVVEKHGNMQQSAPILSPIAT